MLNIASRKEKDVADDDRLLSELASGVCKLIELTRKSLNELPSSRRISLYARTDTDRDHHLIEAIAELAYESLAAVSNGFDGDNYTYWHFALEWMDSSFGRWNEESEGMDPLQQRIAIELLDKVRDNMASWYPAISRPLLAVLDPLGHNANPKGAHPYRLLEEMLFSEWQKFPSLAKEHPEKLRDFLPPNVKYDRANVRFIHRYRDNKEAIGTDLTEMRGPTPSPFSDSSWRDKLPANRSGGAPR
jgi:hypothetical protein